MLQKLLNICKIMALLFLYLMISFVTLQSVLDWFELRDSVRFYLALLLLLMSLAIFSLIGMENDSIFSNPKKKLYIKGNGIKIFDIFGCICIVLFVFGIVGFDYVNTEKSPTIESLLYQGASKVYWLLGSEGKHNRLDYIRGAIQSNDNDVGSRIAFAKLVLEDDSDIEQLSEAKEYCDSFIEKRYLEKVNNRKEDSYYELLSLRGRLKYVIGEYDNNDIYNDLKTAYDNGIDDADTVFYYAAIEYKQENWEHASQLFKTIIDKNNQIFVNDVYARKNVAAANYWCADSLLKAQPEDKKYTEEMLSYYCYAAEHTSDAMYLREKCIAYFSYYRDQYYQKVIRRSEYKDAVIDAIEGFSNAIGLGDKSQYVYEWRANVYCEYGDLNVGKSKYCYRKALDDLDNALRNYETFEKTNREETSWSKEKRYYLNSKIK